MTPVRLRALVLTCSWIELRSSACISRSIALEGIVPTVLGNEFTGIVPIPRTGGCRQQAKNYPDGKGKESVGVRDGRAKHCAMFWKAENQSRTSRVRGSRWRICESNAGPSAGVLLSLVGHGWRGLS